MYVLAPPPVRPGDRVGVAALSGPVDPERLAAGLDTLRALGFEPVAAANLASRAGLFAGSDEDRLAAFHGLAADASLKAIFFARGGHGLLRLLERIDWVQLAETPRAYVGYSDLSVFLNLVVRRLGLVAYHGPMVAVEMADGLTADEQTSLLTALAGKPAELPVSGFSTEADARGPLVGGCLSVLTATLGTPWAVPTGGSILFWEDVGEPLYRLDRMLTHLRLSGSLTAIQGMVVGRFDPEVEEPHGMELADLLRELSGEFGWPVAWGCPSGHSRPNLTIPLGAAARLSSVEGCLGVAAGSDR